MFADRVKQTSTYPGGSVSYPLDGTVTGFRTFLEAIGAGKECHYVATNADGSAWEIGIGVVTAGTPPTLARSAVITSTNPDPPDFDAVAFAAGTLTITCTPPARGLEIAGVRHNMNATANPGTSNDTNEGYGIGSLWANTGNQTVWLCCDNWSGGAVWTKIGDAASP